MSAHVGCEMDESGQARDPDSATLGHESVVNVDCSIEQVRRRSSRSLARCCSRTPCACRADNGWARFSSARWGGGKGAECQARLLSCRNTCATGG